MLACEEEASWGFEGLSIFAPEIYILEQNMAITVTDDEGLGEEK